MLSHKKISKNQPHTHVLQTHQHKQQAWLKSLHWLQIIELLLMLYNNYILTSCPTWWKQDKVNDFVPCNLLGNKEKQKNKNSS